MPLSLVPPSSARPQVFPTTRLEPSGKLAPDLRAEFRRIDDRRNGLSVVILWFFVVAIFAAATQLGQWWVVLIGFVAMGPIYVRFAILMHEAAHKLLFTSKRLNDDVGRWLIAYPAFVPIGLYRRSHFAHHREEFGPEEPDIAFYAGYPCEPADLRRRLLRDAVGISGWKNFRVLLAAMRTKAGRTISGPILGTQAVLWGVSWAATGAWWAYPLLWWLPWMTQWRVLNRLRAIGEHGGMEAGRDRRVTTHNVTQHLIARIWFVPYNTGWHLAHHVDMGIPWRNLPRYHAELEASGYITPALTYSSYLALWRAATSATSA
ncbi:MAG: fatty acid desaturase [Actinomycetes bacterium]